MKGKCSLALNFLGQNIDVNGSSNRNKLWLPSSQNYRAGESVRSIQGYFDFYDNIYFAMENLHLDLRLAACLQRWRPCPVFKN